MKKKLKVIEIFLSINGETSLMGLPTTFIRLAGCNLFCWNGCDTQYALSTNAGCDFSIDEIIERIRLLGCPRVCLTGGEPLLNTKNSMALLENLNEEGFKEIIVETNGSIDLSPFKNTFNNHIKYIMDLKPPSSGMHTKMHFENINLLTKSDEIKFVIGDRKDFLWATEQLNEYMPKARILFSPLFNKLQPSDLVKWIIQSKLWNSRMQLQLHKYIWSPEQRGV